MNPVLSTTDVFHIACCSCGKVVTGSRQTGHQAIPCPECREPIFVLPRSPWKNVMTAAAPRRWRGRDWLVPLCAMALTAGLLITGFMFFWRPTQVANLKQGPSIEERFAAVIKLIERGNVRQARHDLDKLVDDKELTGFPRQRDVRQLARETGIVCDLLAEPLEDILQAAGNMEPKAWELEFRERYHGKAVLFDAHFQRDAREHWRIDYHLVRGRDPVRLDFDRVDLLQSLAGIPLPPKQRLLLGVRLEEIKLEPPGPTWVVRFDKTGGVLLTQRDIVVRQLGPDLGLEDLLELQAGWLSKIAP